MGPHSDTRNETPFYHIECVIILVCTICSLYRFLLVIYFQQLPFISPFHDPYCSLTTLHLWADEGPIAADMAATVVKPKASDQSTSTDPL